MTLAPVTSKRRPFHIPGSARHLHPSREFHVEHTKIELRVDLVKRSIAGAVTATLVPTRDDVKSIHLDACEMAIKGVEVDGDKASFDHDGKTLSVSLPAGKAARRSIRVDYSAQPKQGVYFVGPDDKFPDKPVQAWTQGEPEFSRYWYPCHDHPNDKGTSETVITVPKGNIVVSNGKLLSRKEGRDGWVTFHWREDVPHSSYLNSFVAGEFGRIEKEAEGVALQYYFPESKRADALRLYGLTPQMLKVFEGLTGVKYPYEKYSQIAVHDYFLGGMENVSATTLTDTRFPDAQSEEDYQTRYSRPDRNHIELVAHELAHMWFGDLVTAKHWSHLWLNEGFATYFQALFTEKQFGKDEFRWDMVNKAETYFEEDETMYRRAIVDDVYVWSDDVFDANAYEKGSWMIHQLRYIMGDGLFFRGVGEYLSRYARSNADTHDFMEVMERVSGYSLEGYFDQAFLKAGHPEFEVTYSWDEETRTAGVAVRQTQEVDDLTPVFSLPCDLVFYLEGKGRLERSVKKVVISGADVRFNFELPSRPAVVEFDPEEWLLKKVKFDKPVSMLLAQLTQSVDASSRRRAAEGLGSFKNEPDVVAALEGAVERDADHHSVRSEAAKSLGKIGSANALEALLGLAKIKHRRVRRAVLAALGEFKDPKVGPPLLVALRGDVSPYVRCQAALSYGKARLPDAYEVLTSAVGTPSPEEAITEASLEALGWVKEAKAREFERRFLPYGKPTRARIGALKGLVRMGWLGEEDVGLLKDILLEDKEYSVRTQVLDAVSELLDRRLLGAVRDAAEKDSDPRVRRRAMEVAIMLEEAATTQRALSDVKDDIEKVKAENRDIRERFSRAEM